jgi:hypothetical protein
VPQATGEDILALLTDYDHLSRYYSPQVVLAKALSNNGHRATLSMRFKQHRAITVVLDAEFESHSGLIDRGRRGYSFSRSMHIWQVDHAGSDQERRRAEGEDDGFLWRLNSYWSFEQTGRGLRVQCEAVSLTRDVPVGLGWLIVPIIQTLPRESLEFTLSATRTALLARRPNNDSSN